MDLPQGFINNIRNTFQEDGRKFLAALPALIDEASARWGLTDVQSVPNLSYNFVAFARHGAEEVMLKVGVPNSELTSEMAALRWFNGDGACRLLDHDQEKGFLLLERLRPGTMLAELEDDDERTLIAVQVMQKLWRSVPEEGPFIRLADWFSALNMIRPHFNGGTGPFPETLLNDVLARLPHLFASGQERLIHGDLHHFNILSSGGAWLAIDPKGVIGPAEYEPGPLLINPWDTSLPAQEFKMRTRRRAAILSERLGWERETILSWAMCHSVLSAWWDTNPADGSGGEYPLWCAGLFHEMLKSNW